MKRFCLIALACLFMTGCSEVRQMVQPNRANIRIIGPNNRVIVHSGLMTVDIEVHGHAHIVMDGNHIDITTMPNVEGSNK